MKNQRNVIAMEWCIRCCSSNIYPNGVMLKEEMIAIKKTTSEEQV